MSNSIAFKLAVGIDEPLLNFMLEQKRAFPNLQAFYHRSEVHATALHSGRENAVMFGAFVPDNVLASALDEEIRLARAGVCETGDGSSKSYLYGIRLELSLQNYLLSPGIAVNTLLFGDHEDFDFSQVAYVVKTEKDCSAPAGHACLP